MHEGGIKTQWLMAGVLPPNGFDLTTYVKTVR
jgi:hypothetical protein